VEVQLEAIIARKSYAKSHPSRKPAAKQSISYKAFERRVTGYVVIGAYATRKASRIFNL
jgi:hypothetical protein